MRSRRLSVRVSGESSRERNFRPASLIVSMRAILVKEWRIENGESRILVRESPGSHLAPSWLESPVSGPLILHSQFSILHIGPEGFRNQISSFVFFAFFTGCAKIPPDKRR